MSWETIDQTYQDDGITTISLDRPDKNNAQNYQLIHELDEAMREADADDDVRVIVLAGKGASFSSGHDLSPEELAQLKEKDAILEDHEAGIPAEWVPENLLTHELNVYMEPCMRIRDLSTPTIAQVHGYCGAAGLMLTAMCDLVVATEDATFQNPVLRFGAAGVELLVEPWEIGVRKAKELLWTGDVITGQEAEQYNLVNRAVPEDELRDSTMTMATKVARMPPFAVAMTKKSLNHTLDQMGQRDAFEYHMLAHQLSHHSDEWTEWHEEGNEIMSEEGFGAWLSYRDDPFDVE